MRRGTSKLALTSTFLAGIFIGVAGGFFAGMSDQIAHNLHNLGLLGGPSIGPITIEPAPLPETEMRRGV